MSKNRNKCKRNTTCHYSKQELVVKIISNLDFEYRSVDGSGNNRIHPEWGKEGEKLLRLCPQDYSDGRSEPSGQDRPSSRLISNEIFNQVEDIPNPQKASDMFWLWGQFIDHLLDLTPENDDPVEPFNILVPIGDPYFDPESTGSKTIPLNRSIYDSNTGQDNPRQQLNLITSFIDGSNIYGSNHSRNKYCRKGADGQLLLSQGYMLPYNNGDMNNAGGNGTGMYVAGDVRANENVALTAMHTLWAREHNRWAKLLKDSNPEWTDEKLYQNARAIVEAELQVITYNEFLPLLLGFNIEKYSGYREDTNPGIANEFSTAAYRLGHSLVSSEFKRLNNDGEPIWCGNIALKDAYFCPWKLSNEGGVDPLFKGFSESLSQKLDSKVIDDLRNFLFGNPGEGGLDLVSLNIQRGRDHGLSDYNTARESYGLDKINTFEEITSDETIQIKLEQLYENVDNIDLWVGILVEDPLEEGMVGELCSAIVKDQFERVRDGDRFWYENRFPRDLRRLLRKTTLREVIYKNTGVRHLHKYVMVKKCRH